MYIHKKLKTFGLSMLVVIQIYVIFASLEGKDVCNDMLSMNSPFAALVSQWWPSAFLVAAHVSCNPSDHKT